MIHAGVMSGLTIGLLTFNSTELKVLLNGGEPKEKIYAASILELIRRRHLLLG